MNKIRFAIYGFVSIAVGNAFAGMSFDPAVSGPISMGFLPADASPLTVPSAKPVACRRTGSNVQELVFPLEAYRYDSNFNWLGSQTYLVGLASDGGAGLFVDAANTTLAHTADYGNGDIASSDAFCTNLYVPTGSLRSIRRFDRVPESLRFSFDASGGRGTERMSPGFNNTYSVLAGDFDRGGVKNDIVASLLDPNTYAGSFFITNNFSAGTDGVDVGPIGTAGFSEMVAADLFRDGSADDLIASFHGYWIRIFRGNGDGTHELVNELTPGGVASSLAVGDLNGDGLLDLLVGLYSTSVRIFLGDGAGNFAQVENHPLAYTSINQFSLVDLDSDGKLDLLGLQYNQVSFILDKIVIRGLGNSNFFETTQAVMPTASSNWPMELLTADVNGDGKQDVVSFEHDNNLPYPNNSVVVVHLNRSTPPTSTPTCCSNGPGRKRRIK